MQQIPAAILVLSASIFSYASFAAKSNDQHQASAVFVLTAIVVGLWGMISLVAATMQERDALLDADSRLDFMERVIRAPMRSLRKAAQRFAESDPAAGDQAAHAPSDDPLEAIARATGRDRSELLAEFEQRYQRPTKPPRAA